MIHIRILWRPVSRWIIIFLYPAVQISCVTVCQPDMYLRTVFWLPIKIRMNVWISILIFLLILPNGLLRNWQWAMRVPISHNRVPVWEACSVVIRFLINRKVICLRTFVLQSLRICLSIHRAIRCCWRINGKSRMTIRVFSWNLFWSHSKALKGYLNTRLTKTCMTIISIPEKLSIQTYREVTTSGMLQKTICRKKNSSPITMPSIFMVHISLILRKTTILA